MSPPRKPEKPSGSENLSKLGLAEEVLQFPGFASDRGPAVFGSETVEGSAPELQGLGKRIASLRRVRKITQDDLSDRVLVSLTAVKAWEAERSAPRAQQLVRLAEELQVSLDYLLLGRGDGAPVAEPEVPVGVLTVSERHTLGWSLHFAETAFEADFSTSKRAEMALEAAAKFRQVHNLPAIPDLEADLLGITLGVAEKVLGRERELAASEARMNLAIDLYEIAIKARSEKKPQ